MNEISQADFDDWKSSYVGKKWFAMIANQEKELKEALLAASIAFPPSCEALAIQIVNIGAKIEQLQEILDYRIEAKEEDAKAY
jgi:hypothetical protein